MARYLVLGTGMGEAIAYALLRAETTESVTIADIDKLRLAQIAGRLTHPALAGCGPHPKLRTASVDVTVVPQVKKLMRGHDVVIAAVSYDYNAVLVKAAIEERVHFLDLGGNNDVVAKQFAMSDTARDAGVAVIPDNGIAPGAVSILTMHALALLGGDTADLVQIRVGGLPQRPEGPLGYAKAFSIRGLVNEYAEPPLILREGKETFGEPLGGREEVFIPGVGMLEAAFTSGGSSTLTKSLAGKVNHLDYKTLRHRGHWEKIKLLYDLGLFGTAAVVTPCGTAIPREVVEEVLDRALPTDRHDLLALRIAALKGPDHVTLGLVDRHEPMTDLTAMQRTTGFSAAIVARMIGEGVIAERGTLRLERVVPSALFIERWGELGLHLTIDHQRYAME